MRTALILLAALVIAVVAAPANAVEVVVTVTGEVEFNQINPPPLGDVNPGDAATLTFSVDSDTFVDSSNFPTRGYDIDQATWMLDLGAVSMPLQDPYPGGQTPYFGIRNNDPAVDGFWVSESIDFPIGVPLNQFGFFDWFRNNFYVTYTGDTLDSLDILDALGTYDFTNLTVFNWTVDDGPFQPLGIVFTQMTIELGVQPGACCTAFDCEDVLLDECVGIFQGDGTTCADEGICEGPLRITICHYPPGNMSNPRTITVNIRALEAHLDNHGDTIGECPANDNGRWQRGGDERQMVFGAGH